MGKVAIVRSSQLHGCWSAKRYLNDCYVCDRVENCKLPEAKTGRLQQAEIALGYWKEKMEKEVARAQAVVDVRKKELEG